MMQGMSIKQSRVSINNSVLPYFFVYKHNLCWYNKLTDNVLGGCIFWKLNISETTNIEFWLA